jgi:hypothetical protein
MQKGQLAVNDTFSLMSFARRPGIFLARFTRRFVTFCAFLIRFHHVCGETGHVFVRYTDDCNICVKSERAGQRVMASVKKLLTDALKLKVNESKSALCLMNCCISNGMYGGVRGR